MLHSAPRIGFTGFFCHFVTLAPSRLASHLDRRTLDLIQLLFLGRIGKVMFEVNEPTVHLLLW
jgi:hypothetical protein